MRRPWMEADGSVTGAGGIGVASPPAAAGAAAPSTGAPPPQAPQLPQQLEAQHELQLLCRLKRLPNRLQRFFLQQLSQLEPQQAGSQQAGSQQAGSQQAGSQQAGSQQAGSQQLLQQLL